jgi:GTPase SAR1 family protein
VDSFLDQIYRVRDVPVGSLPIMLCANKIDLTPRDVTTEEDVEKAKRFGAKYLEVSAKDYINVREAFIETVRSIMYWEPVDAAELLQKLEDGTDIVDIRQNKNCQVM